MTKTTKMYKVLAQVGTGEGSPDRVSDDVTLKEAWEICHRRRERAFERGMSRRRAAWTFFVRPATYIDAQDEARGVGY